MAIDFIDKANKKRGIEEKLDIDDTVPVDIEYEDFEFHENREDDLKEDYEYLRTVIRKTIDKSQFILSEMMKELRIDKNPFVGNICVQLSKTINDGISNLTNLHKDYTKIEIEKSKVKDKSSEEDEEKSESNRIGKVCATVSEIIAAKKKAEGKKNGNESK